MSVPAVYAGVVLSWATTAPGIKQSGAGVGYLFGVVGRMILDLAVCLLLISMLCRRLRWHPVTGSAVGVARARHEKHNEEQRNQDDERNHTERKDPDPIGKKLRKQFHDGLRIQLQTFALW